MLIDIARKIYPIGTKVGYRYRLDQPYMLGTVIGHQRGLYGEAAYPGDRKQFYIEIRNWDNPDYTTTFDPTGGFVKVYYTDDAIYRAQLRGELIL